MLQLCNSCRCRATSLRVAAQLLGCWLQEWEGLTIGSLLPGMLVNVKVRNVLSDGLLVSFLTFFNGTIDCFHLTQVPPDTPSTGFLRVLAETADQVVMARGTPRDLYPRCRTKSV